MDVVKVISAPLPRHTRHIPVDAYLLPALHGATWARSAATKKTTRTTGSTTLQEKIRPRIVRAVCPAYECDLDHLVSRDSSIFWHQAFTARRTGYGDSHSNSPASAATSSTRHSMNNTDDSLPALGGNLITTAPECSTSKHPRISDHLVIRHGQGELHRVGLRREACILFRRIPRSSLISLHVQRAKAVSAITVWLSTIAS